MTPFHLAFPVHDLETTRAFYIDVMGCAPGRSSETWTDFSLFGHQMSAHLRLDMQPTHSAGSVGKDIVPIPHFGVVLTMAEWRTLAAKLEAYSGTDWIMKPSLRFEGEAGEQATLFIRDPSGNALEFKGFKSMDQVFAT